MFVVCACSRFQVQPKVSHMYAVKRIFRYLKGHPTLGLWYPKDSPLELIAYLYSDYACASLDRKSTIGVDGKAVVISESLVRGDLLFDDEDGITFLTNDVIFENLSLMGYEPLSTKHTFQKVICLAIIGNKMNKAFPLSVKGSHCQKKFPLLVRKVPPVDDKRCHCQKDCTAIEDREDPISDNIKWYQSLEVIEFRDTYEAPDDVVATGSTTKGTGKKEGRSVALTTEDMQKRKNDVKARTTLLLALPDEHQLRFSKYKTTQELWNAILKTFGVNKATKKTKKNLLKQQYGNLKVEDSKTLEQTFNRMQAIVSHLEFMDIEIEQDDLNQKFLTSLVYESKVQKKSELNLQNTDFISSAKNSSGKEDVNTASIPTASTNVPLAPRSQDRGRRDKYRQGSKVEEHTPKALMAIDGVGWDWSFMANEEEDHALVADEETPTEFALMAKTSADNEVFDNSLCSKTCKKNTDSLNSKITELTDKLSDTKNTLYHYKLALKDLDSLLESQRLDKNKEGLGTVLYPPHAQVCSPPKKDLSWIGLLEFADDTVTNYTMPSPAIESTSYDVQNRNPYVTETEASPSTISSKPFIKFMKVADSPTIVKTDKKETVRKPTVKYAELYRKTSKRSNVRGNQRNWNNLKSQQLGKNFVMKRACYNCGSVDHLSYNCNKWVDHGRSWAKNNNTHKSKSPRTVIHKPNRPPIRTNSPYMNAAQPKRTSFYKPAHSYNNQPFQRTSAVRSQFRAPRVPTLLENFPLLIENFPLLTKNFPLNHIDDKCYWDGGCSRYMTGNISYLSDYEPFDGGYVSFGQRKCKTIGKGTIKTDKLEFENVYFVKDLKYNLISVSQIYDNKNSVLFIESECIVLGRDFKLIVDTNVLLRTPRQHNMYSIDLNNIVPYKDLTCLVAKASVDECMLWHRRLGHLNIKIMNRLVRHNLVRGLPFKYFENNHTCVACLKGKQHKASCKTKLVNSVTKPLYTLHMDLFGPTSVSSHNHKWYCLVVTDDFSRFTWTFFLKTKDETSGILRNFITKIENLKELRVKKIRCDNGGEFRNKEMNDFCSRKGIKREFSNARTPQQNGVLYVLNYTYHFPRKMD
uniref:Putative ribonuclease H-like domain-containing protein n=1 Tax=Tanacetum cinerariifolium TaxID=118510 RepID=A0A6L2JWE5_TANCI|nr:putative ribonuclease H-like domain-containing protein [Tanacetum cinerariifolium]